MKKLFVSLLCAVMLVTFMPSMAFAAGSGNEARIGTTEYPTLKEALEVGGEVELLKDVEVCSIITVKNDTTLNLKGKIITNKVEKERAFHIEAKNFTINADGGGMIIPESNLNSYGFIKIGNYCERK